MPGGGCRFTPVNGSEFMSRLVQVPTIGVGATTGCSFVTYYEYQAFGNWNNPLSLVTDINTFTTVEADVSGGGGSPRIYMNGQDLGAGISYFEDNILTGLTTPFGVWIAAVWENGGYRTWYRLKNDRLPTRGPANTARGFTFTPTQIGIIGDTVSASSRNGTIDVCVHKIWADALTEAEIYNEMYSRFPKRWTRLTFWNPFLGGAALLPQRDWSGGVRTSNGIIVGGDFGLTGTPLTVNTDPGVPFRFAA